MGTVHTKVKFIGISIGNFSSHGFETGLFAVIILGAEFVIGFFFEEAEVRAGLGLGPLLVGYPFDGIA